MDIDEENSTGRCGVLLSGDLVMDSVVDGRWLLAAVARSEFFVQCVFHFVVRS